MPSRVWPAGPFIRTRNKRRPRILTIAHAPWRVDDAAVAIEVRGIFNRRVGERAVQLALVAAVLAIAMLADALTVSATSTAETASVISVHTGTTVVPLPADSYTDVASLFLPMGTRLLIAKADFVNVDDAAHSIKCRLVAGGQADITGTGLTKEIGGPYPASAGTYRCPCAGLVHSVGLAEDG